VINDITTFNCGQTMVYPGSKAALAQHWANAVGGSGPMMAASSGPMPPLLMGAAMGQCWIAIIGPALGHHWANAGLPAFGQHWASNGPMLYCHHWPNAVLPALAQHNGVLF
jgi:hypothetical protein